MENLVKFLKKYKTLLIIGSCILVLIILVLVIGGITRDHSVKEFLYDTQRGELYLVRDDGKEIKQEIKLNKDDALFRNGEFLIHRRLDDKGEFQSDIYSVSVEEGLRKEEEKEGSVIYYVNDDNMITVEDTKTYVKFKGKESTLEIVCRSATFHKEDLLCVNQSGILLVGTTDNLEPLELSEHEDEGDIMVISVQSDNYKDRLYVITATTAETPTNEIHILDSIDQLSNESGGYEKYIVDEVPRLLTIQEGRVVLNTLRRKTQGDKSGEEFSLYVLDNGLKPLTGYRYPLLIVY